jgi:hypothetical protein
MEVKTIIVMIIIAACLIAGVKTAAPNKDASKPCWLGYRAMCSFTPFSTVDLHRGEEHGNPVTVGRL